MTVISKLWGIAPEGARLVGYGGTEFSGQVVC